MAKQQSYFFRPYAPAWGILIGTVMGAPIDFVVTDSGAVTGALAMLRLIIGTVIYYEGKSSAKGTDQSGDHSRESRLRELEELRSKSLISDEVCELKRKEILSDL